MESTKKKERFKESPLYYLITSFKCYAKCQLNKELLGQENVVKVNRNLDCLFYTGK